MMNESEWPHVIGEFSGLVLDFVNDMAVKLPIQLKEGWGFIKRMYNSTQIDPEIDWQQT